MATIKREKLYRDIFELVEGANVEPLKKSSKFVSYGTAGFRGHADTIRPLVQNIGLCAALRCYLTEENTGIMVTASHNPIQDNGVKIIDGSGEMLCPKWEGFFERFVNIRTAAPDEGGDISRMLDGYTRELSCKSRVIIGCDTRPSSNEFVRLLMRSIEEVSATFVDLGVLTTPALHYLVGHRGSQSETSDILHSDYYDKLLIDGFVGLNESNSTQQNTNYDPTALVVDCANGVGQKTMQYLLQSEEFMKYLPVNLINTSKQLDDILNHECGADFVKTKQLAPRGASQLGKRYASLDGDADRLVYFFMQHKPVDAGGQPQGDLELKLIDGDKILCLYVKYLKEMLNKYELADQLSLGTIQTAYANGASTDYLRLELGLSSVDCADTGVKNLHKKALAYDLAVYFEANGHGTILVSKKAKDLFHKRQASELQQLLGILNNYTGDAVSDILMAETMLKHYDWDIEEWYSMYQDRPNSLTKVEVRDRNLVKTTDAGRLCLEPDGLQHQIDLLVNKFGLGSRSFVRASGTENVVRIYAEAKDKESANELAELVGKKVIEMCNIPV